MWLVCHLCRTSLGMADAAGQLIRGTITFARYGTPRMRTAEMSPSPAAPEARRPARSASALHRLRHHQRGLHRPTPGKAEPCWGSGVVTFLADDRRAPDSGNRFLRVALAPHAAMRSRKCDVVRRVRAAPSTGSERAQTVRANRFSRRPLTWHDPRPRAPSSEIVPLNPNRRDGSGGSNDHARSDDLKLDAPVKQDGPLDGHFESLSDR
jgi:hypothetical protein